MKVAKAKEKDAGRMDTETEMGRWGDGVMGRWGERTRPNPTTVLNAEC